jgi:hypothetical protein
MPADPAATATPDAALDHIGPSADLIVPPANGEPVTLLDAVERAAERLEGVRVHQMHVLHDRPYLHGAFGHRLRHVSYFLSHVTRPCFHDGTIDLVPNHEVTLQRGRDMPPLSAAPCRNRIGNDPDRSHQHWRLRRLKRCLHRGGHRRHFLGAKVPDQARPAVDDVEVNPSQPSSTVSSS